ncbi:MAG: prevent-host-death protein [Sulfurimonas sp.]|uniref:type II toxin-antitoxin system Phd/YefM family antitoxin n=1 Tax=Sulfurimonas sp. TaxID=2022749 RepID=UPI0026392828|nr:type II toxin-antitoxin system Phd/YefM family antitoxin [Sulfurimonas sp.]MDD2651477.1 prevent-host-death protein [Sulfurimonas sp.]MDD3451018.1 prevent-host-death protein [Sulfurimonas sp.]
MVAYKRDEIVSASDVARGFSTILNNIINHTNERLAISKNNKLEAVILDIQEYEKLQTVYDLFEENEIKQMLAQRSKDELEVSHSKIISIEV